MTSSDAGTGSMRRSDRHAAAVVFGILIGTGILLAPLEPRSRVVGFEIVCTGLLGYVARSWVRKLPWRASPAYRLIVVTVALLVLSALVTGFFQRYGSGGVRLSTGNANDSLYALAIGLLAVPTVVFIEMYFRGVLYSRLEERGGSGLAVAGSAAAAVAVSAPLVGRAWVPLVEVLALSLLLAASRRQTESLVPAVVVQGLGGVVAFLFGILSALS